MKRASVLLLALLLSAIFEPALAREQLANIFGQDDRVGRSRERGSPYSAVGVLQQTIGGRWRGRGTATLVSPCHVLTAYHIAFGGGRTPGEPRAFAYGPPQGSEPFGKRVRAFALIWGEKRQHFHEDWALLRLEPCVEDSWVWWPPLALDVGEAKSLPDGVMMAGYPVDRPIDQLSVDPSCQVRGRDRQVPAAWLHDCATRVGDSGGAIFQFDGDGQPRFLAVVHAEGSRQMGVAPGWTRVLSNYAVPVENFIDRIRPYLDAAE